jgi:hypothetical protein
VTFSQSYLQAQFVEVDGVEGLLIDSWGELDGNDSGGMAAYKLLKRTEKLTWNPSVLEFEIERHGSTVMGSVYAAVQVWRGDVQKAAADLAVNERRLVVGEPDKSLKVEPIVRDIETLILEHKEDSRLKWLGPTCVRVEISKVIPATIPQTTSARRRRFRKALEDGLKVAGWRKVPGKLNTFAL